MKIKSIIIMFLIFCFILSIHQGVAAQAKKSGSAGNPIKLKSLPELGIPFPVKKVKTPSQHLMIASAQIDPYFVTEIDGMLFDIAFRDKGKIITYIGTTDDRFKTSEGIMVGDTLAKVLATSKSEVNTEIGWAYFVSLGSGWNAAFVQGRGMTEGELLPESKVVFLFKR